jgi:endonuclease-8
VPEGDTIFRTAATLRHALAGKRVVRSELPREGRAIVEPGTLVTSVEARGKHLLIGFEGGIVLHTHMKMTGSWHTYRTGERWRVARAGARAVVEVDDMVAVCVSAPVVELLRERALASHPRLSLLGPDLCSDAVDLDQVVERVPRFATAETQVGVLLLDQRVACGIGNVYKSEVLFARRVDPFAPVGSMTAVELRELYFTASELLRRNLEGGPRTTVPGGLAVYDRANRPCIRCGTAVVARKHGETPRVTYWCPSCQPSFERAVG